MWLVKYANKVLTVKNAKLNLLKVLIELKANLRFKRKHQRIKRILKNV